MPLRGFRQVKRCTVKNASRMFISALSHISASITAMPSPMRARTLASINTFLTLFFCTAVPAYAEIYRCTSHEGKMISADRVPAECRGKLIRVFSDSGSFKSEIMPPLSAAEKQKKAQEVESQQQQKMVAEEFLREERFLTAHFRSESDITQAQKKALELVEAKKKMVLEQLDLLANIVYELRIEISNAKQLDKNSKSFQQLYQSRLDELTRSIKKSQDQLATYETEIDRINREYDQTLQRYRVVVVSRRR
ncbi:hypothetical protein H8K35_01450 [Undibacterium sp. LX40W]|uniref:DUF4124 domain-containing protein n=2 Tax=Undibacterium nitidum TaxID=2762298 RepID=A0A923KNQ9_9BURK|nr:hypothetical protein [Undibacterium sp. LX40W]MBC3880953.1 hypothetical protein [Undibacterium nitidum]MBC3890314.1 hypothetical protein [Undibacterium sp. LX40W]